MHQQFNPMSSVAAIIRRDKLSPTGQLESNYLLIKRHKEGYNGKWSLVGGRWEFGESLETSIIREVKEESGLNSTFVALRGLVNERIAPYSSSDYVGHFLLFVCEVSTPTGKAREQSDGPVAWFTFEEIERLQAADRIIATDVNILQHFCHSNISLPYYEAVVLAGEYESSPEKLVQFEQGP